MSDDPSNQTDKIQSRNLLPRTTTSQILMSKKLTGDQIRDAIAVFTSGGSVKLPLIPRPKMKMKVCMLGDAQHVEKMGGDTVDLEVDKLPDIDDEHSIGDDDVIINFGDVMELDKELSSLVWGRDKPENGDRFSGRDPEYNFLDVMELDKDLSSLVWGHFDKPENDDRFSGRDPDYEDIDISNFQLFKDYIFKKRDEDESGREENVGNDDKIEEDTKRQFGTAFVASKDVFGQQKKQKLL